MRILLRLIAILAAVSVLFTVWFVIAFARIGGLQALSAKTALAAFTFIGWVITLGAGPFVAIQLWRLRDSGRRAGLVMFGFGLAYYLVGLLGAPQAQAGPAWTAALIYAVPFAVLLSKPARETCRGSAVR